MWDEQLGANRSWMSLWWLNEVISVLSLQSPAARFVISAGHTVGAGLGYALHWNPYPGGRVVVPPVSSDWLVEHERTASKHGDDA